MEDPIPLVQKIALREGTFERLNAVLREHLRGRMRRNPPPSAGIAHSQSAKTIRRSGRRSARPRAGGNKVRDRKRHLLVDTEGLVLDVKVHSAKVPDQNGIKLVLETVRRRLPRLAHLWVETVY